MDFDTVKDALSHGLSGSGLPSLSTASRMERNLIILNGLPSLPGRSWVKNTGAPKFLRMRYARIKNTGERKISPEAEAMMSNRRLKNLLMG